MRLIDYFFRCLALGIVWFGIAWPCATSDLFVPVDRYDLYLAAAVLASGLGATFIIWCGPELVRAWAARGKKEPPARTDGGPGEGVGVDQP